MAINSLRNKPFGPGGGTRRLHQSDQISRASWLLMSDHSGGGEIGSTRV